MESLKGCFLCTDWSIFHELELNEATETVTDYINFCVDNVVPKKTILHFPNNKPYITKEVKTCINNKKVAFKNGDRGGMAAAQKELNRMLTQAKSNHRAALEESVGSMNSKGLWDHVKKITNMNSNRNPIVSLDELAKANELNDFFLRHDTLFPEQDFNINSVECNDHERLIIDPQQVQLVFSKVGNKKSTGPDGLPALLLKKSALKSLLRPGALFFSSLLTNIWFLISGKSQLLFLFPKYLVLL